jgi:hypothetical protein
MEVHHHSSHGKKKLTDYFWEFLMLFLAVFCGFLAEYQLEHTIEHAREKQYMKLMIADLQTDTAEMNSVLKTLETRTLNVDSMLLLLNTEPLTDEAIIRSYRYTFPALANITFSFNDRTITQLKNSGNMRIIRNQKVNDSIIHYWNHIDNVTQALTRHISYRTAARMLEAKIYNVSEMYMRNNRQVNVFSSDIRLIPHERGLVREYANIIADAGIMIGGLKLHITNQNKFAAALINLIRKEYHFE